ncbi:hypothetical protein B4923_16150 [Brenneria roseae subsp. americana]|uniref:Tetratricopeptide repeat protein n=1 Tax=Brenneria roseae subsp. americana TaxID=1508507 RepID=A0A2U1TMU3_9GAMM|nr:hypothetical protein [Brenneria roseae]PWC10652.1 hypothetical protein B4923_16150 [Brenneria roseae subsp. americana]
MSAPIPQPKTNELLAELFPSINAGNNLIDEFTLKRIIREAKKLPNDDQALHVEGLARIISGEVEHGITLCEKAISINPHESVNWSNYLRLLQALFLYNKEFSVISRVPDYSDGWLLSELVSYSVMWCKLDLINVSIDKVKEMRIELNNKDAEYIISLAERYPDDMAYIEKLAGLVMDIAEEEKIPTSSSMVTEDMYGYLAYGFRVKTDDPNYLFYLNDKLADRIIDAGLGRVDSVALFEAEVDE